MNNMKKDNYFLLLQRWYLEQCNGDWEHEFGIKIDTLDNPGWSLQIDLTNTTLEEKAFSKLKLDITEDNWVHCWVAEKKFQGGGGPSNLVDLVKIFIEWANS